MIVLGADMHKSSHTIAAVSAISAVIDAWPLTMTDAEATGTTDVAGARQVLLATGRAVRATRLVVAAPVLRPWPAAARRCVLDGLSLDPYLSGRGLSLGRYLGAEQRRAVTEARRGAERASRLSRTTFVESRASIVAGIGLLATMLDLWERIEAGPAGRDGFRLAFMLDEGLKAFAPRVSFVSPADLDLDSRTGHADFAPLLHVLILQMAHAIANDWHDVRTCADDRCGKLFCRQEGRATVRSPRNDSMFCSHVCARRFHQRNYRKQKRNAERR